MQALTRTQEQPVTDNHSYIHNFREYFGKEKNITEKTLTKQKELFGFSFFLLHSLHVSDAVKIGFLNSYNSYIKLKRIWLIIPFAYIFGSLALGFLLQKFNALSLFLPIFFGLIGLSFLPAIILSIQSIQGKVKLYKESRIFFNLPIYYAHRIQQQLMITQPIIPIDKVEQILMYLSSQPFIYGYLHQFADFPISELIIFDIVLFLLLFGILERGIFLFFRFFYSLYFTLLDHLPWFFSPKDQERDFYMDLYESGNELLTSLDALERDMTDAKNGVIQPTLGDSLTRTIEEIEDLYSLIDTHEHFLSGKDTFKQFLRGLLNEVLTIYAHVFDFLDERIKTLEKHIDIDGLSLEQRSNLLGIVKPLIENKKKQLAHVKSLILDKRIGIESSMTHE
ncbi:hypothetical protein KBD33_02140 [Candidatus Gracilibacteria bacterium]|nr:hypothetical protein [Candidatus Gracilibacteria bacterium]